MSDFKTLKGLYIKHVSSDPANPITGQIWYNTTTQTIKVAPLIASWSAGGNMGSSLDRRSGAGLTDAEITFLGTAPPYANSDSISVNTETYDGSSWTEVANLSTARFGAGSASNGTQTAALAFSGRTTNTSPNSYSNATEEWGGSGWTNGGNYPASTVGLAGAGTQTAGLGFGGSIPSALATTAEYNGTSWTAGEDMTSARSYLAGFGLQTAALAAGGAPLAPSGNLTEEYDGTNWTNSNNMNTKRNSLAGNGIQTAGLIYGGTTGSVSALAELYDGSSWTATATLATARSYIAGFGSAGNNSGLSAGGTPATASTEEFTNVATARSVDTT